MIIQSRRVWILDTFMECQIEMEDGNLKAILPDNCEEAD